MSGPITTAPVVQPSTTPTPGSTLEPTPRATPAPSAPIYGTSTPRLLRMVRNVVIAALLLFAGLTIVGTIAPEVALGDARDEVTYGMQLRDARATLAEADRRASVAFLDPKTAATAGEWTTYQTTLDTVSSMLVMAAAQHPDDADQLAAVQTQVSDYRRAVESARTVSATDAAAGGTQYAATSQKLAPPLVTLAALAQTSDDRVGSGAAWMVGTWAVVAAWIALVVLVLSSVVIALRTRRVLNVGLVVGLVLVGVALGLVTRANGMVQQSVSDVRTTSLASARIHAGTRALAEQAKAAEGRSLLASGSGSAAFSQVTTELAAALESLPNVSEKEGQTGLWQSYVMAHQALPSTVADAKNQARTTTLTPLTAFVVEAQDLSVSNASDAGTALSGAQQGQLPIGITASLLGLLAIAAALWGITRRLAEYV